MVAEIGKGSTFFRLLRIEQAKKSWRSKETVEGIIKRKVYVPGFLKSYVLGPHLPLPTSVLADIQYVGKHKHVLQGEKGPRKRKGGGSLCSCISQGGGRGGDGTQIRRQLNFFNVFVLCRGLDCTHNGEFS
jgi:hypothetical protein